MEDEIDAFVRHLAVERGLSDNYQLSTRRSLTEFAQWCLRRHSLKNPREVTERAVLEVFVARELYGLSLDDWKHLTGTFTFGSGETKSELDEIMRQSLSLWQPQLSAKLDNQ